MQLKAYKKGEKRPFYCFISFRKLGQLLGLVAGEEIKCLRKDLRSKFWPKHSHLKGRWAIIKANTCLRALEPKVVTNINLSSNDTTEVVQHLNNGLPKECKQAQLRNSYA